MRLTPILEGRSAQGTGQPGGLPTVRHDAGEACRRLVEIAFACAEARFRGQRFVLVKADGIELPLRPGASSSPPHARIVFQGLSSITVAVCDDGAKSQTRGHFMLLAVDADGLPVPIQSAVAEESRP